MNVDYRHINVDSVLPQKKPFQFVDGIVDFDEATASIVTTYTFSGEAPYMTAHFPDNPVVPGTLLTEALAQTCALCQYCLGSGKVGSDQDVVFQFDMKFHHTVRPEVALRLKATRRECYYSASTFKVEARTCAGQLIATGLIYCLSKS